MILLRLPNPRMDKPVTPSPCEPRNPETNTHVSMIREMGVVVFTIAEVSWLW